MSGYPDAGSSVRHSGAEVIDGARLVKAGEPPLVILSSSRVVLLYVLDVFTRHLLNRLLYVPAQTTNKNARKRPEYTFGYNGVKMYKSKIML